jgi:hypothetical protein
MLPPPISEREALGVFQKWGPLPYKIVKKKGANFEKTPPLYER